MFGTVPFIPNLFSCRLSSKNVKMKLRKTSFLPRTIQEMHICSSQRSYFSYKTVLLVNISAPGFINQLVRNV